MANKKKTNHINISSDDILEIYNQGPEAVIAFNKNLINTINELIDKVEKQAIQIKKLEDQLSKNSKNSSKPPSSDGFNKPKPKSLRKKSGKKQGGQKGHKGYTLNRLTKPDIITIHNCTFCPICGKPLHFTMAQDFESRQVVDIEIKIIYTEHRAEIKECECGEIIKADFPDDVNSPIQYGKSIKTLATYLSNYQFLPYKRAGEFFLDVCGLPISTGTLANMNKACGANLKEWKKNIKSLLLQQEILHFDETGFKLFGKRHWLHSVSNSFLTLYAFHKKRGTAAITDIGILPAFNGKAVHDHWQAYFNYVNCIHILCNAHHLRELTFIFERCKQEWANNLISLLCIIKKETEDFEEMPSDLLEYFSNTYDDLISEGFNENPLVENKTKKRGRKKKSKPQNLLERLKNHKDSILAFMYNNNIPFDNNLAERDLRMMKVQQKISGTFRGEEYIKAFCLIRSYISTLKKNNQNIFNGLQLVFNNNPFLPQV